MEGIPGKRGPVPRKGSGPVLKDNFSSRNQETPICSRTGCTARPITMKGTQNGSSDKAKSVRGKEIAASSSKARKSSANSNTGKKLVTLLETDSSESSSIQDDQEVKPFDSRSSTLVSSTRTQRSFSQKPGITNRGGNLLGSSIGLSTSSSSQGARANASKNGFKSLRCNSIADVIPTGCSSSDSVRGRKKDLIKKRNSEAESSSSNRGKKTSGSSVEARTYGPNYGLSISDTRQARNFPSNRDNNDVGSVRTRRSTTGYNRTRLSNQGSRNNSHELRAVISDMTQPEIHLNVPAGEIVPCHRSPFGSRPGSSRERVYGIMPASPENGITLSLTNRDSMRSYNVDGIAEVLLALERIEQDEELTYEQLLVLETNLFLNGLSFYDQHREMRLDIDNMSYEELLALEDRMGTVSTALNDEALAKCLRTSIYQPKDSKPSGNITIGCLGDDNEVKCSICQEEYVVRDELGRLQCEHKYHIDCISQWLRLKNWCPICKTSAQPLSSSSTDEEFPLVSSSSSPLSSSSSSSSSPSPFS